MYDLRSPGYTIICYPKLNDPTEETSRTKVGINQKKPISFRGSVTKDDEVVSRHEKGNEISKFAENYCTSPCANKENYPKHLLVITYINQFTA